MRNPLQGEKWNDAALKTTRKKVSYEYIGNWTVCLQVAEARVLGGVPCMKLAAPFLQEAEGTWLIMLLAANLEKSVAAMTICPSIEVSNENERSYMGATS